VLLRLRLTESRADSWKLPAHLSSCLSLHLSSRARINTNCLRMDKRPELVWAIVILPTVRAKISFRALSYLRNIPRIRHLELLLSSLKDSRSLGETAQEHNLTSTVSTGRAISWSHCSRLFVIRDRRQPLDNVTLIAIRFLPRSLKP
jgi:hypothetical protein